jgi:hypothetical protein
VQAKARSGRVSVLAAIRHLAPPQSRHVIRKLTDCALHLYAAPAHLDRHLPIRSTGNLHKHPFIGYTDEIDFSPTLDPALPAYAELPGRGFASTNLVAQYKAEARAAPGTDRLQLGPMHASSKFVKIPNAGVPVIDATAAGLKFGEMLDDLHRSTGIE